MNEAATLDRPSPTHAAATHANPVALRDADLPALADHLARLSPDDRDLRFQGKVNDAAIQAYANRINLHRDVLCGAFVGGRLVAACHVGVYLDGGDAVGEVGISVDADQRGTGIARRVIESARAMAAERGVRRLDFVFLRGNHAMLGLARRLGAAVSFEEGEWQATIGLPEATPMPAMRELRSAAGAIEVLATDGDDACTALLVHGAGGDPWQFRRHVVPFLREQGYRVVAPSLRHHGRSARTGSARLAQHVADVLAVIRDTGRPRLIVGHSMGALVVQHVAQQVPVPRMALLAPVPHDGLPGAELAQALGALKSATARTALAECLVDAVPIAEPGRATGETCVVGGLHDAVVQARAVQRTAAFHRTRAILLDAGHVLMHGRAWEQAARAVVGSETVAGRAAPAARGKRPQNPTLANAPAATSVTTSAAP